MRPTLPLPTWRIAVELDATRSIRRQDGTDTAGNVADKQTALGVSLAMMKVYDLSVPRVKPAAD